MLPLQKNTSGVCCLLHKLRKIGKKIPLRVRIVGQNLVKSAKITASIPPKMQTYMVSLNRIKRFANRFRYSLGLAPSYHPAQGGWDIYRKKSKWPMRYEMCPCDCHFIDYLKKEQAEEKVIFHFGTGAHHWVGLENSKLPKPNHVTGITASAPEHATYVNRVIKDKNLAKYYTVLFKDIYTLVPEELPYFDYISLFHLCEFYLEGETAFVHHDDKSLLKMFISRLNPGGRLLFYIGSFEWARAEKFVREGVDSNSIRLVENFESLLIYEKVEA